MLPYLPWDLILQDEHKPVLKPSIDTNICWSIIENPRASFIFEPGLAWPTAHFRAACIGINSGRALDPFLRRLLEMVYIVVWISLGLALTCASFSGQPLHTSASLAFEPFTTLKRSKLIGLYGFNNGGMNEIPLSGITISERFVSAIAYDALLLRSSHYPFRLDTNVSSVKITSDAVDQWSIYLSGSSKLVVPLNIDTSEKPYLTVGAWVKSASSDSRITDPGYDSAYCSCKLPASHTTASFSLPV